MADSKKNYANIENIGSLLGTEGIGALLKNVQSTEKKVSDILRKLSDLENAAAKRLQEESSKAEEAVHAAESESKSEAQNFTEKVDSFESNAKPEAPAEKAAEKSTARAEEDLNAVQEKNAQAVKKHPTVDAAGTSDSLNDADHQTAPKKEEAIKQGETSVSNSSASAEITAKTQIRSNGESVIRTQYAERRAQQNANRAAQLNTERSTADRMLSGARTERQYQGQGERGGNFQNTQRGTYANSQQGVRPSYNSAQTSPRGGYASAPAGSKPYGPKPNLSGGQQGRFNGKNAVGTQTRPAAGGRAPAANRFNAAAAAPVIPSVAQNKNLAASKKKAAFDKQYVEQKRTVSKRALIKQQVSVSDFDEDKSGYRKLRVKKQKQEAVQTIKIEHAVVTTENIALKVLSEKLGITAVEITKRLFKEGIAKTINDSIDYDTAAYIANDLGIELEYKPEKTAEEALDEIYQGENQNDENAVTRPPVVTVMGHVDHGKTSLLDKIRSSNVTAGEAGGITQHIGAYSVNVGGKIITFLDTPGHEAFTAMRARGASVTDIVVLVVAADDGIMPQTVEAINHAKAADVPIIVAVNKMDKPEANLEKVKQGLTNSGLVPEEWGGDAIVCPVSAKTGEGIDNLLESINLIAEVREYKANPNQMARGTIIEAKLDKGKGPVASVLIQNGTLHTGDNVISGTTMGRVRAMIDDKGRTVKSAGPSMAVSILGLEDVPNAGDSIIAVEQDKLMKQVLDERKRKESESMIKSQTRVTLDDVFDKIAEGKIKGLNIIVKGDVQGSVEAVKQSLLKLSNDEVRVNIIHSGAGAITESDVMLADSSNAIIVGFNVRPDAKAKNLAEHSGVDVRSYRIIYELLDDIQAALKGMLAPKYREIMTGKCDVLQTFKITGVGMVAGCYVTEGKIVRQGKLRIYRDDVMIVEGAVRQLKRFKDDVKEVSGGFECGVSIEGFDGIKVGDVIECYITEEIPA